MGRKLTTHDVKETLTAHVQAKGVDLFCKFGPRIGWTELLRIIEDRACVRYPCELVFDAAQLLPGELVAPVQKGDRPEDGFVIYLHPRLSAERDRAVCPILYQLVVVNYGGFASADDAETFGAAALGLTRDEYYGILCGMADEVAGDVATGCECGH